MKSKNAYLSFAFLKKKPIKLYVVIGSLCLIALSIYLMQNKMYEGLENAKEDDDEKEEKEVSTAPAVVPLQMSASQAAGPKGVYENQQETASRQNSLNNSNA
jgi:hypothetical protein